MALEGFYVFCWEYHSRLYLAPLFGSSSLEGIGQLTKSDSKLALTCICGAACLPTGAPF